MQIDKKATDQIPTTTTTTTTDRPEHRDASQYGVYLFQNSWGQVGQMVRSGQVVRLVPPIPSHTHHPTLSQWICQDTP